VWQSQHKVAQPVQQHVSYEFIWTRIGLLYLVECSLLRAV